MVFNFKVQKILEAERMNTGVRAALKVKLRRDVTNLKPGGEGT